MMSDNKHQLGELRHTRRLDKAQSCPYFQGAKIHSCAFVQDNPEGHTAHPYYYREPIRKPDKSGQRESWYRHCFRPKPLCNLAMQNKPLVRYDPSHSRSRMPQRHQLQTISGRVDSLQIGTPMSPKDIKEQYKTTYSEFFKLPRQRRLKNCSKFSRDPKCG